MAAKTPAPARRELPSWVTASVLGAGLLAALTVIFWPAPPDPDKVPPEPTGPVPPPALTASPYLNTRTGVAYVGDAACAGCHPDHSKAYRQHPMGRSLFHAADAPPLERYDGKNTFQAGRFHFQVDRQGDKLIHKEWCQDAHGKVVAEVQAEIAFAIGSGSQARSYFVQRDGFLFESPITWYSEKAQWDLSPGYEKNQSHFHRRIESRCLYCHCQEARPVEHTINRYQQPVFGQLAIGCERCHGPGQLHVASRLKGVQPEDVDYTIVNPRRLERHAREAVCQQCHLQGEAIIPRRGRAQADYRPGLALHEFVTVFVRPAEVEDPKRIVGHVEQMYQSACFQRSEGRFGCISCHDPHRLPPADDKVSYFQQRCRNCHGAVPDKTAHDRIKAPDCSLAKAKRTAKDARDNCLACHMPRHPSTTTHLAVTDHRLLRHADRPRTLPSSGFRRGDIPLLSFHRQLLSDDDGELPRDLALATIPLLEEMDRADAARELRDYLSERALDLLDKAVLRGPDDVPALEARGFVLFSRGRLDDALKALDLALTKAPDREQTLGWAAEVAAARDQLDRAEQFCRRLTEKYPHYGLYHERLALLLTKRRAWPQALDAAQAALRVDPFRAEARELLITALLEMGNRDRAQAEFDALGAIDTERQEKFRPRFTEGVKRLK